MARMAARGRSGTRRASKGKAKAKKRPNSKVCVVQFATCRRFDDILLETRLLQTLLYQTRLQTTGKGPSSHTAIWQIVFSQTVIDYAFLDVIEKQTSWTASSQTAIWTSGPSPWETCTFKEHFVRKASNVSGIRDPQMDHEN